jgi:hypothetical protein
MLDFRKWQTILRTLKERINVLKRFSVYCTLDFVHVCVSEKIL